mmetsp:Transcript_47586/g.135861  ORF Transcript_47586/g.135861 Transcript_47586/m.135861 type:complete len:208 (+) Transcript_47586:395-1018(+)
MPTLCLPRKRRRNRGTNNRMCRLMSRRVNLRNVFWKTRTGQRSLTGNGGRPWRGRAERKRRRRRLAGRRPSGRGWIRGRPSRPRRRLVPSSRPTRRRASGSPPRRPRPSPRPLRRGSRRRPRRARRRSAASTRSGRPAAPSRPRSRGSRSACSCPWPRLRSATRGSRSGAAGWTGAWQLHGPRAPRAARASGPAPWTSQRTGSVLQA